MKYLKARPLTTTFGISWACNPNVRQISHSGYLVDTLFIAAHMVMWAMSDRGVPRSFRMMQGFGVNTFTLLNASGERHFVKFHFIPELGVHSLVWDEALKINGQDPDFHRKDLNEAIENGAYPKWKFAIQTIPESKEHDFDFDILDATKIWPQELVPLEEIGELVLNRVVDEFFPETEQVAFCTSHVVPGIGFSDDPLLQGRNFSYFDTQISRLGINWEEVSLTYSLHLHGTHSYDCSFRSIDPSVLCSTTTGMGRAGTVLLRAMSITGRTARIQGVQFRRRKADTSSKFTQVSSHLQFDSGVDMHSASRVLRKGRVARSSKSTSAKPNFSSIRLPRMNRPTSLTPSASNLVIARTQLFTSPISTS